MRKLKDWRDHWSSIPFLWKYGVCRSVQTSETAGCFKQWSQSRGKIPLWDVSFCQMDEHPKALGLLGWETQRQIFSDTFLRSPKNVRMFDVKMLGPRTRKVRLENPKEKMSQSRNFPYRRSSSLSITSIGSFNPHGSGGNSRGAKNDIATPR